MHSAQKRVARHCAWTLPIILVLSEQAFQEIAAYYILGSPSVRRLLSSPGDHGGADFPPRPIELIQRAIVGKPISDSIPLLHEFISGPFDADKLDYMPRDATLAGVPVVTDIGRLVQKVRAVRVTQADLPSAVASRVTAGLPSYTITGVAMSGGHTLDELMLGRTLLFDKIYRHHKARAAEAMIALIIKQLIDIVARAQRYCHSHSRTRNCSILIQMR